MLLSSAQTRAVVIGASAAFHVWIAVAVASIKAPPPRRAPTSIAVRTTKAKPPEKKPEPELPKTAPQKSEVAEAPKRVSTPKPASQPTPTPNATPSPVSAGEPTELAGNFGNGGTLPVGSNGGPPAPTASIDKPAGPKIKALAAIAPIDECTEPPAKPKPVKVLQPAYTEEARSLAIEGRVRVEITVDETGAIASARVLSGLGHGLDEAALAAAKGSTFQAAVRCGKPVRSTFTIGMRFSP